MSNLIKSSSVFTIDQLKRLQWINQHQIAADQPAIEYDSSEPELKPDDETIALRDQILSDAQKFADERLRDAAEASEKQLADAEEQIAAWWEQKRQEDAAILEASREAGFEQGLAEGTTHAELLVKDEWEQKLAQASDILQSAYTMREQIIQEAEPFLVELSCAIAEKIIGQQLTLSPQMAIELIRHSLSRRREQGVITLCVAPEHLAFVQAAREELNFAIDSQAELQILPDSTVKDNGCVIRSAYGSIDARIDTQLTEIKRELIQYAHRNSDERGRDDDA